MKDMAMGKRSWLKAGLCAVALVLGLFLLSGCGASSSTVTTHDLTTSSTEVAPPASTESFEDIWTASVAAVETLGPVRISIEQEPNTLAEVHLPLPAWSK